MMVTSRELQASLQWFRLLSDEMKLNVMVNGEMAVIANASNQKLTMDPALFLSLFNRFSFPIRMPKPRKSNENNGITWKQLSLNSCDKNFFEFNDYFHLERGNEHSTTSLHMVNGIQYTIHIKWIANWMRCKNRIKNESRSKHIWIWIVYYKRINVLKVKQHIQL